jgi:hypothetical protein
MNKSILIQYIFSLTNLEIKEFRLWLQSPLHNSRTELIRLFDYIITFHEKDQWESLEKTAAFKASFPNEKYVDKQLRYAMSFLLQQLKSYLIWKGLEKNEVQQQQFLLNELREKNLLKAFKQTLKKVNLMIENQSERNVNFYHKKYELASEAYEYLQTQSRAEEKELTEVSENFSIYYIANALKLQCNIMTHKSVSLTEYDEVFFQKLLLEVENGLYENIPLINIYYHIYKALKFFPKMKLKMFYY